MIKHCNKTKCGRSYYYHRFFSYRILLRLILTFYGIKFAIKWFCIINIKLIFKLLYDFRVSFTWTVNSWNVLNQFFPNRSTLHRIDCSNYVVARHPKFRRNFWEYLKCQSENCDLSVYALLLTHKAWSLGAVSFCILKSHLFSDKFRLRFIALTKDISLWTIVSFGACWEEKIAWIRRKIIKFDKR